MEALKITENFPRKCFRTQERETRVKFNPGLSANRPSNNWAQITRRLNVANNHFGPAENPPQSLSEAENRFGEKHMKRKLRAVPGCRCQIAQNHYQKEGDLTLNSTQQDRRQEPRSTASETTFITDDISTRRATLSLSISHLRVDDNS